jgi:hypothetical protein
MFEDLKSLYIWISSSQDKGFIVTVPTFDQGIHLTIGFDNRRKEFNIHLTNDNIKDPGAKRRDFLLVLPSFRFFLMMFRLTEFLQSNLLYLIFSNRSNLGKMKKHNFILIPVENENIQQDDIFKITKKGRKCKPKMNVDPSLFLDNLKYATEYEKLPKSSYIAYKMKGSHLSMQGIIFNFPKMHRMYFVPIKQYNRNSRNFLITFYNYLNYYPTKENLPFRKFLYKRLANP